MKPGSLPFVGAVLLTALGLCFFPGCKQAAPEKEPIPVVVQISSITKKEQLVRRIDELKARGLISSVKAGLDVVDCDYLKQLANEGFEIMGTVPWQENDTYEEQLSKTLAKKQALEACIGKPIVGFSPEGGKFNRGNQNTFPVLREIGAKYVHTSARYETLPCYALEPYQVPEYNFVRVPMQSRCLWNVGANELDQTTLDMNGSN